MSQVLNADCGLRSEGIVVGQMRNAECGLRYTWAMPRFVVLLHETPVSYPRGRHLDLMLEHEGVLQTWAMDRLPAPDETIAAEQLPDHRVDFLDYEGELTGDRGRVSRVEAGHYALIEQSDSTVAIKLSGEELCGVLKLTRDEHDDQRWRVIFSSD